LFVRNNTESGGVKTDIAICVLDEDKTKKPYIFQAPDYEISDGDSVVVETSRGQKYAKVINHLMCVTEDDRAVKVLRLVTGINEPLKRVLSKVRFYKLGYKDEGQEST
jgi:cell fate regulator YaaT (PSP1 superfamily)